MRFEPKCLNASQYSIHYSWYNQSHTHLVSDGPHQEACFIKQRYHSSLFHLNKVTNDLVVEIIDLLSLCKRESWCECDVCDEWGV